MHAHIDGARLVACSSLAASSEVGNGEGQVNRRDETGSQIIDLLRLLDLQFAMLCSPSHE